MTTTPASLPQFPFRVGDVALEVVDAHENGGRVIASMRVIVYEDDDTVRDIKEQAALDLGPRADLDARVAVAKTRMVRDDAWYALPWDLLRPFTPFVPVRIDDTDAGAVDDDMRARLWVQSLTHAIYEQAIAHGFDGRFDTMSDWGEPPRTLYFLSLCDAMVGGNGFEVFLAQAQFGDVAGVLHALETAGCDQLVRSCRRGIALAARQGAEFVVETDKEWLNAHSLPPPSSWRELDSWDPAGSWALLKSELWPAMIRYARRYARELVAGEP